MERSYDVHITFATDSLRDFRFYGSFSRDEQGINEILQALEKTGKVCYKQENKEIDLSKKYKPVKVPFTKEMKDDRWTILCPQMSPIHFQFVEKAMQESGYNLKVLPSVDKGATEAGLKYVNNDACYPSILVAGQMMEALTSGEYDVKIDKDVYVLMPSKNIKSLFTNEEKT